MRKILVQGDKRFMLSVPDDAVLSFGPWSPPNSKDGARYDADGKRGTLRVYTANKKDIIGVFSGVVSFRDTSLLGYAEEVAREEVSTIWKDDEHGYLRETKAKSERDWITPKLPGEPRS